MSYNLKLLKVRYSRNGTPLIRLKLYITSMYKILNISKIGDNINDESRKTFSYFDKWI